MERRAWVMEGLGVLCYPFVLKGKRIIRNQLGPSECERLEEGFFGFDFEKAIKQKISSWPAP